MKLLDQLKYPRKTTLMKRDSRILPLFLLLLCCGTLAVLDADEPMRRWRTRLGGVLTGTWDRSLDAPDGSLIRIRSQSNIYRVRVDDLIPEDRWYVLSQRIEAGKEPEKTSSTRRYQRGNASLLSGDPLQPQPLHSATDPAESLTAPIPGEDPDWGISDSQPQEPETISTDDPLDTEFVTIPESPEVPASNPLPNETPGSDAEDPLAPGFAESPFPPPTVPGSEPGERRVYEIRGVSYAFRWCPAGTFEMGSPRKEPGRSENEPLHEVTLTKGFWILETEVTQRMWESLFDWNPSWFSKTGTGAAKIKHVDTGTLPVEQVTWEETALFCEALRKFSGWRVTLPTEAQWEYACRAGTETAYSFGTEIGPADANYDDSEPGNIDQRRRAVRNPYSVAGFRPNGWGIYDMHGNVAEWCRDRYGQLEEKPTSDPTGSDVGNTRVFRGGSWFLDASCCRSAYRYGIDPDTRAYYLGFRIIIEP